MYKQSAIHYMGNKLSLLSQILPYFPRNIKTFYDIFGGSGTVSLNVKAEKYILNDLNNHLYNLYDMFKNTSADNIISYCETNRDKYGFSIDVRDKPKIAELNHKPYYKCREDMNNNPSTLGFYFLTFYSFCNQFRFNNGKFNMPVGNGYFKEESKGFIKDFCEFMSKRNVYIYIINPMKNLQILIKTVSVILIFLMLIHFRYIMKVHETREIGQKNQITNSLIIAKI